MDYEEDIERSAAFDEQLREHTQPVSEGLDPKRLQTIRLLHEVFRADLEPPRDSAGEEDKLPDRVARFRIKRMLGRGGFGTVYLAEDPLLNRLVAIKVIHEHLLREPAMRRRALRERDAMGRLQHPNIIPVWEAGEDQEQLFIVSEYCPGPTLAQWLAEHEQPLSASLAARWVLRLADAVAHSHQRGVIHRDLKPSNILLDSVDSRNADPDSPSELEPRLSDFGLAKIVTKSPLSAAAAQSEAGLFVGSIDYASPEQIKGIADDVGAASDVYALGVLLYQLLTRQLPHTAPSQYELARRICEEHVRFPKEYVQLVPNDLQAITLRAMARDRTDRYRSAEALRDDLGRFLRGEPVEARPVAALESLARLARRRPVETSLAIACCLLALLFGTNLIASNRRLFEQSQALQAALHNANVQRSAAEWHRQIAEDRENSLNDLLYRETMKIAFDQWQQQNYIGLHETLERVRPNHQDTMECQWLRQQLESVYKRYSLNDEPVKALTWHPGNKCIVGVSASGKLRRWYLDNAVAFREDQTALGAHSIALHPDGKTMALPEYVMPNARVSHITFWDYETATPHTKQVQFHSTTVESLEYSPDGRWIAAGPRYANVVVTDLENNDESFAIKADRRNRQVLFSPESDRIAVYTKPGKIEIHDLRSRKLVTTIRNETGDRLSSFYSMAWMPGRDALVTSAGPDALQIYSATDGQRMRSVSIGMEGESIAVSADGKYVSVGNNQGVVRTFSLEDILAGDVDDVSRTGSMRVLNGKITDMAFVDNHQLVAADDEGNMVRLSLPARPAKLDLDWSPAHMTWSDNEHLMIYGENGAKIQVAKLVEGQLQVQAELPFHVEEEVSRACGMKIVAMAASEGKITLINKANGSVISTVQLPPGKAVADNYPVSDRLLFSADEKVLYATGDNNEVTAINVDDGSILWAKKLTNSGSCMVEDPVTQTLALGGGFEALKLLDTKDGNLRNEYVIGNGVLSLCLHGTPARLISGHRDGTVRTMQLVMGQLVSGTTPRIHRVSNMGISALVITPDNQTVIAGDLAGIVRFADEEIMPYGVMYRSSLPSAEVKSLQWSPDRKWLAGLIYSVEKPLGEVVLFKASWKSDAH